MTADAPACLAYRRRSMTAANSNSLYHRGYERTCQLLLTGLFDREVALSPNGGGGWGPAGRFATGGQRSGGRESGHGYRFVWRRDPRRVLLHSSGLHGVEGFAGSAIQLQFLDSLPRAHAETAFVIVHVLNPYGMAWLRRVNENNVDLNRNCLGNDPYAGAPPVYRDLNSFLNPEGPPTNDLFALKAVCLMVRHGTPALKQAVVGGQYEYPKGLFFGGKGLQEGLQRYESFLAHRLAPARQVLAIDVHTGLGKYGEDTLLVDAMQYAALRRRFGERVARSDPRESPAYQVTGALESMIFRVLFGAQVQFLRQEFGTYGPIKVLQALRQENRAHHYDDGRSRRPAKTTLRELFCPADESWRQSVLKRGSELLSQALAEL